MTPDIALIKLARPVQMFNSTVRPICLASPGVLERPLCPDMSKDRGQYWVRLTLPAYVGTGAVLVSCLIIFLSAEVDIDYSKGITKSMLVEL